MLELIRNAAKTWIAKVILVLILVPFALFGLEGYLRQGVSADAVATVAGEKILSTEYDAAVQNQLERFRQQFGTQIDASIMDNPEMRKGVLDQLINQRLIDRTAASEGLKLTEAKVLDLIQNNPNFQEDGKFSTKLYERILRAQGRSHEQFKALLRQDLERQQFVDSFATTSFVSKASVAGYLAATEQSRDIAIVNIAPDAFAAKVNVTTDDVKKYYDDNKKEFTIPEQVRAEYVALSIEALAPSIKVAAEDVKKYFETNKARFISKQEERKASHILITAAKDASAADKKAAEDKAKGLFAELQKNPKRFAELAKANSQDPGSGANGGDLGFFGRGQMVPPFEQAAFGAKKDEILAPVLSDFGYHIIVVTDIKPEVGKSLAEATPEIEGELKKQEASRKFAELAEKFSNAGFENSSSLKAAADVASLSIKQTPFFSKAQGIAPFNNPKLSTAFFASSVQTEKRNTEAVEVGQNNLVIARLLESKPAVVRPLEEVQAGITQRLTRERTLALVKADGEAKLAELKAGKAGVTFPALLSVSRANPGGLPPNVIDAAMRVNPKALPAFAGVDNPAGGYTLIQVAKVNDAPAADETKLTQTRSRIEQALSQKEILAVLAVKREENRVEVKKGATDKKAGEK
jgi:peptidyl-prolyl cis-trans isomerase D